MGQGQEGTLCLLDAQSGCTEKWPFTRRRGGESVQAGSTACKCYTRRTGPHLLASSETPRSLVARPGLSCNAALNFSDCRVRGAMRFACQESFWPLWNNGKPRSRTLESVLLSLYCHDYHCNKVPDKKQLKEGFVVAHSLRVQPMTEGESWQECEVAA